MTAYTTYLGGDTIANGNGFNAAGLPAQVVVQAEFDASKRNLAAADTAVLWAIPAGTYITNVYAEVLTTDDATHVYNVGTTADPDGFVAGDAADAAGVTLGAGTLIAGLVSTGTDLVLEAATGDPLDTLKVRIFVECTILGT